MRKRELEELALNLNRRLHAIEEILSVDEFESIEFRVCGFYRQTKKKSMVISDIKKQIKMLAESLGYEFKPKSTTEEPAKFVKKETIKKPKA